MSSSSVLQTASGIIASIGHYLDPKQVFKRIKAYINHLDEIFEHSPWHWLWFVPCCFIGLTLITIFVVWLAMPDAVFFGHKSSHWLRMIPLVLTGVMLLMPLVAWVVWTVFMKLRDLRDSWRYRKYSRINTDEERGFVNTGRGFVNPQRVVLNSDRTAFILNDDDDEIEENSDGDILLERLGGAH